MVPSGAIAVAEVTPLYRNVSYQPVPPAAWKTPKVLERAAGNPRAVVTAAAGVTHHSAAVPMATAAVMNVPHPHRQYRAPVRKGFLSIRAG